MTRTGLAPGAAADKILYIDSDMNPSTGDEGDDYAFDIDYQARAYYFMKWNGSDFVDVAGPTVRVTNNGGTSTISVNRSDLGNTAAFNFGVVSLGASSGQIDYAPDNGEWNFTLSANGPDIQSVSTQPTAAAPKAGQPFSISILGLKVAGETTGTSLAKPETYNCTATLGGRPLPAAGAGGCSWNVPRTLVTPKAKPTPTPKGKKKKKVMPTVKEKRMTLAVTVNVTYEGATKPFSFSYVVG
jgi:hypothetical protein